MSMKYYFYIFKILLIVQYLIVNQQFVNAFEILKFQLNEYPPTYSHDTGVCEFSPAFLTIKSEDDTITVNSKPYQLSEGDIYLFNLGTISAMNIGFNIITATIKEYGNAQNVDIGNYTCIYSPPITISPLNNHQIDFKFDKFYQDRVYFKISGLTRRYLNPTSDLSCSPNVTEISCQVFQISLSEYYYAEITPTVPKFFTPFELSIENNYIDNITQTTQNHKIIVYPFENMQFDNPLNNPQFYPNVQSLSISNLYVQMSDVNNFLGLVLGENSLQEDIFLNMVPVYGSGSNYVYQCQVLYPGPIQTSVLLEKYNTVNEDFEYVSSIDCIYPNFTIQPASSASVSSSILGVIGLNFGFGPESISFFDYPYFSQEKSGNVLGKIVFTYPFGLLGVNTDFHSSYEAIIPISIYQSQLYTNGYTPIAPDLPSTDIDIAVPFITKSQLTHYKDNLFIITLSYYDEKSGVYSIQVGDNEKLTMNNIIQGTIRNGTLQKIIKIPNENYPLSITILDRALNYKTYEEGDVYNTNFDQLPVNPFTFFSSKILGVRFAMNNVNVSSSSEIINEIYIRIENPVLYYKYSPEFTIHFNTLNNNFMYPSKTYIVEWNSTLKEFKCSFTLPKNLIPKEIKYDIGLTGVTYSNRLLTSIFGPSAKLTVTSTQSDEVGPIISNIQLVSSQSVIWDPATATTPLTLGFDFTIVDQYNGYNNGYIMVSNKNKGDLRGRKVELLFNSFSSNITHQIYSAYWEVGVNECISQKYEISYIYLEDSLQYISEYYGGYNNDTYNPMMVVSQDNLNYIDLICSVIPATTTPMIDQFNILNFDQQNALDISNDNTLQFVMNVSDTSGLSNHRLPVLYLLEVGLNMINTTFEIIDNSNPNYFSYQATITIPKGFGGGDSILISVYGIFNNILGYTSTTHPPISSIQTYLPNLSTIPIIATTSRYTSDGGLLTLYGQNFQFYSGDTVKVSYSYDNINFIPFTLVSSYFSEIIVSAFNIKRTFSSFNISVDNGIGEIGYTIVSYTIPSPSSTPSTTKVPSQCYGVPQCGGSTNGRCTSSGCVCISPWYGNDCLSKPVILSSPPNISTIIPETSIQINSISNLKSKETVVQFKNQVGILELREYNFKGKVVKLHNLKSWTFTNLSTSIQTEYHYSTILNEDKLSTTLNVTILYFNKETTIEFANEEIQVQPSTMKYKITLSPYNFLSTTNSLQLVMSASISSNSEDSCSLIENGNSSDPNFEYIKVQVNDHSIYGKLIKKAEIDYRISSITNSILNDSSSSSSSEIKIGLNIPFFTEFVYMDPDFSLLLDSRPASDSSNSICSPVSNSSKLTKEQLIGIIIGSVVGGIIIITLIIFFVFKKSNSSLSIRTKFTLRKLIKR